MQGPRGGFLGRAALVRQGRQSNEHRKHQECGAGRHPGAPLRVPTSDPTATRGVPWGDYNCTLTGTGDTMTVMRFEAGGRSFRVDFGQPVSLAIPLDFAGPQPSCFGAPRAESSPLRSGGFTGDTRLGGSCNCEVLTLAPHCNGTHTECVGHVTDERVAISERLAGGVQLAQLVTVEPVPAEVAAEDSDPRPAAGRSPGDGRCARTGCGRQPRSPARGTRRAHAAGRATPARLRGSRAGALSVAPGGRVDRRARHRDAGAGPAIRGPRRRRRQADGAPRLLRPAARARATRAPRAGRARASPSSPGSPPELPMATTCSTCRSRPS